MGRGRAFFKRKKLPPPLRVLMYRVELRMSVNPFRFFLWEEGKVATGLCEDSPPLPSPNVEFDRALCEVGCGGGRSELGFPWFASPGNGLVFPRFPRLPPTPPGPSVEGQAGEKLGRFLHRHRAPLMRKGENSGRLFFTHLSLSLFPPLACSSSAPA